jgi:hypothetical protein
MARVEVGLSLSTSLTHIFALVSHAAIPVVLIGGIQFGFCFFRCLLLYPSTLVVGLFLFDHVTCERKP